MLGFTSWTFFFGVSLSFFSTTHISKTFIRIWIRVNIPKVSKSTIVLCDAKPSLPNEEAEEENKEVSARTEGYDLILAAWLPFMGDHEQYRYLPATPGGTFTLSEYINTPCKGINYILVSII